MNLHKNITTEYIKKLGKYKSDDNLDRLIYIYNNEKLDVSLKSEVVSSIGRLIKVDKDRVYNFIENNVFEKNYMDVIYQMYRTLLYNRGDQKIFELSEKVEKFYDNEMIYKMKEYYLYKKSKKTDNKINQIDTKPQILEGDSSKTLKNLETESVHLIFTSPPYYNAREYSTYKSYKDYLKEMKKIFLECHRVLENGRFIIINISPVITKRPGREFESIRYPIHFDFHNILEHIGYYFVDEILWIKPEPSVPNRNGGYIQTRKPLSYKPNCISESIIVYRKKAPFLLDENIKKYKNFIPDKNEEFQPSNCWYIAPSSNKIHPAVFPEELCKRILKYYSFKSDVVLDPFAGSGTFGKVALEMGRVPILCEQDEKYINYMKEKLKI